MFQRQNLILMVGCLIVLGLKGCTPAPEKVSTAPSLSVPALKLTSSAFAPDANLPPQYTCDGKNLSPALSWNQPPEGTQSFVLIVEDPDAPGKIFSHWVLYDLPAKVLQLPEGLPAAPFASTGGGQGKNDFGKYGYGGPCPPGGTHRYVFKLYALNKMLDLPPPVTKADVEAAMEGHVVAIGELVGKYQRQK